MAASQMPLLLLLTLLTLTASASAISTIYDLVNQFGFPSGILPDSVTSYSIAPADEASFTFAIYLNKPCYVQYDYLVYFDTEISGKITYGKMNQLKGVQAQSFLFWFNVDEINVDGGSLQFTVGPITITSDIVLFDSIPTCKDKALAACDDRSSKLVSKLPVNVEKLIK